MLPCAPLPERLGAYRLLWRLPSRDGTDEYAALEEGPLGFRREVLLKLAPYREGHDQAARDLAREAAAVAALNHPGLVRMYEFFEHEGRLVLVLERGEHVPLGRLLAHCRRQKRPLEDEAVFHVVHRVAGALAHAHGREAAGGEPAPVAHRALGPGAVLLGWDASVRLAGFGFAKILGAAAQMTQLTLARGLPEYVAPEQLRGDKVTERADVYQLGLLVWEMLANRSPGPTPWAGGPNGAEGGAGGRPTSVALLRPTVPPEIVAALDAALEPDAERRTLRASDLERWLARTVDVEAGRDVLCRRLAALRGPKLRDRLASWRSRPRRLARGSRRWEPEVKAPSTLASVGALAVAPLAPPPAPLRLEGHAGASAAPRPPGPAVAPPASPATDIEATLPAAVDVGRAPAALGSGKAPAAVNVGWASPAVDVGRAPTLLDVERAPTLLDVGGASAAASPGEPVTLEASAPPGSAPRGVDAQVRLSGWRAAVFVAGVVGVVFGLAATASFVLRGRGGDKAGVERAVGLVASAPRPPPSAAKAPAEEAPPPVPRGYGSITVRTPLSGYVYINGVPYGPSERPVLSPCGRRNVRVGAAPEPRKRTVWLTAGVWTTIPCGESVEVTLPGSKP